MPTQVKHWWFRNRQIYYGGLTFNGDTAAANALDDYEVGTFNAVLSRHQVHPPLTPQETRQVHYVKVGDIVHFTWYSSGITFTSTGTGNGFYIWACLTQQPTALKNTGFSDTSMERQYEIPQVVISLKMLTVCFSYKTIVLVEILGNLQA